MSEHTPGPWKVTIHKGKLEIMPDRPEWLSAIAHVYKSGKVNANRYQMPSEANARLIARAPELAAEVEELSELVRKMELEQAGLVREVERLRGALDIAKSTIERAIYTEDGIDGEDGQAALRAIEAALGGQP